MSQSIKALVILLPLATLSLATTAQAEGAGSRRTQVFVVPFNDDSASMTTQVGGMIEKSLKAEKDLQLIDLNKVLGAAPPASLELTRKKAQELVEAGQKAYQDVEFELAVEKLKAAIELCRENAAWMPRIPEYTTALTYLAATYILKGDTEEGSKTFKELLLYNPSYRVDTEKLDPSIQNIADRVSDQIKSGPIGSVSVYSKPPGARIFLDNKQKGFTPASLDRIPSGKHVIRLEALGTFPYGEVIEVSPTEDKVVRGGLQPTEEFKKLGIVVREVGREIDSGKVGPAMSKLGQFVGMDWALYGIVNHSYGEVTLTLWVVNIRSNKRLASRRTNFPDSEFTLDKNVESFVKDLLKDARSRQQTVVQSDDPLEGKSGVDDWDSSDKSGPKKKRTLDVSEADISKGRSGSDDPLDSVDGLDDW